MNSDTVILINPLLDLMSKQLQLQIENHTKELYNENIINLINQLHIEFEKLPEYDSNMKKELY